MNIPKIKFISLNIFSFPVAPMRGRGIARGLAAQANRHDPFRSRPPNTSRPPSMHVDDFMKLEKGGSETPQEPSSPMRRESVGFHVPYLYQTDEKN